MKSLAGDWVRNAAQVAEQFPQMILALGGAGLEVNRPQADSIRNECETRMRSQPAALRGAEKSLRAVATSLETRASKQRILSMTAMKTEHWTDDDGEQHSRTVPCTTTRNQASREFMRLTDESREVRISAGEHGVAAENLDQDIRFSGNIFENDCDDVARCDTHFAAEFAALVNEMQGHVRAVQQIKDSFCPNSGIVNWSAFLSVKSGMTQEQQDRLFELTLEALTAQMLVINDEGEDETRLRRYLAETQMIK